MNISKDHVLLVMNYYYPAKVISTLNNLLPGEYGVFNLILYFNNNGVISIHKRDFNFYDLDNLQLYKVACGKKEPFCNAGVLYNVKDLEWVLFKTQKIDCADGCLTTIDRILCKCENTDIECFTNFIEGVSNVVDGFANNIEGNDMSVAGFFNYISGSDQTIPGTKIDVDGMMLSQISNDTWRLTIPSDVRQDVIAHDFMLFPTEERFYAMRITDVDYIDDDNTVIITLQKILNCNEIPDLGPIESIIPTTNYQSRMSGTMNGVNPQKIGTSFLGLSGPEGSYLDLLGSYNLASGSSNISIHGSYNGIGCRSSLRVVNDEGEINFFSPSIINPTDIPFEILYVSAETNDIKLQGKATLTKIGTSTFIEPILPVGTYRYMFTKPIRIRPGPTDTITMDVNISIATNPIIVEGYDLNCNRLGTFIIIRTVNDIRIYNYSVYNVNTYTTVSNFNDGYVVVSNNNIYCNSNYSGVNGQGIINICPENISSNLAGSSIISVGSSNVFGKYISSVGSGNSLVRNSNYCSVVGNVIFVDSPRPGTTSRISQSISVNGQSIGLDTSFSNVLGKNYNNYISYNISLGFENKSINRLLGYFTGSLNTYTLSDVLYYNGVPVHNSNGEGLIANIGGTFTTTRGFPQQTGISYLTFPDSYRSTTLATDDICLPIENGTYQIIINSSWLSGTTTFKKYMGPTYEARFVISGGALVPASGPLINNQHVFVSSNNQIYTTSATSSATPILNSIMLFVDQPESGFISVGIIALAANVPSLNGTFDVVLIKQN